MGHRTYVYKVPGTHTIVTGTRTLLFNWVLRLVLVKLYMNHCTDGKTLLCKVRVMPSEDPFFKHKNKSGPIIIFSLCPGTPLFHEKGAYASLCNEPVQTLFYKYCNGWKIRMVLTSQMLWLFGAVRILFFILWNSPRPPCSSYFNVPENYLIGNNSQIYYTVFLNGSEPLNHLSVTLPYISVVALQYFLSHIPEVFFSL